MCILHSPLGRSYLKHFTFPFKYMPLYDVLCLTLAVETHNMCINICKHGAKTFVF